MVETPSIVIPPPLAPLPRVEAPILQPPIAAPPRIIPQFQKLSVPAAPRVQMSEPFVPMSKPYYHLDGRQIFFNMPTLKQRLVPQPVGRRPVLHPFQHGTKFCQYAVQHLQAEQMFAMPSCNHIYDDARKKVTINSLLNDKMKDTWSVALSNELGRLAQGVEDCVTATNNNDFITKNQVPSNKKVSYANFICDYRPLKSEPHQVRLTVGGDKLECEYDAGSPESNGKQDTFNAD